MGAEISVDSYTPTKAPAAMPKGSERPKLPPRDPAATDLRGWYGLLLSQLFFMGLFALHLPCAHRETRG
eukprot:SAG31_NODE_969_length_10677_cov_7.080072_6_plen_69_part_00